MDNIQAEEIVLGKNVFIEPSAKIKGLNGKAKKIVIGDNSYIGADVQIICDHFELGDYSKIQHHTNIHGYLPCKIGHNAWIGQYSIIDSIGGTTIGNNVGIGAHSQLWSHIKYGDTLIGCRFSGSGPLTIGNDVWFVGHCIVSPITAHDRSMALAGSVVTSDMEYNKIYAGTPAKKLNSEKNYQFNETTTEERLSKMQSYLSEWAKTNDSDSVKVISSDTEIEDPANITYFNVSTRMYNKRQSDQEISFMKFLLPDKAKFIPQQ